MKTNVDKCIELRVKGLTYEVIATRLHISKQRVHQLLTGYKSPSNHKSKKAYKARYRKTDAGKKKQCDYTRRNNRKIKTIVLSHYSNADIPKCVNCGFRDIRALSIDHINGGGSKHKFSLGGISGVTFYKWLIANDYPIGYQTLCMNCQFIKRFENNEWCMNPKFSKKDDF